MTKQQLTLLYVISAAAVIACFFIKPIFQDEQYHHFADTRTLFSIPNFWNVITNVPFVVIGIIGLVKLQSVNTPLKPNYCWFFIGIFLTGFGSAYYHQLPENLTLIWDRLPMTISFMSFFSIIVAKFIDENAGKKFLYPFLIFGFLSIVAWVLTDDLRFYALIQFLPIVLVLIILFLSKKELAYKKYFWLMIVFYTIAKFLEGYDDAVYKITSETMSGHALKHLAAAGAPLLFYKFMKRKLNVG